MVTITLYIYNWLICNHIDKDYDCDRFFPVELFDKNDKFNLVSLITNATQEGYDVVFACAGEIFKYNIEEEAKHKLFQEKVRELENLFKKETLDFFKEDISKF